MKSRPEDSGEALFAPRTGRYVNSSGWNPENGPTTCYDPERVASEPPTGFGPFRAVSVMACRFRGRRPKAIHLPSLRDGELGVLN